MSRHGKHASGDPGGRRGVRETGEPHPHSGANSPSLPRRPGTGERQAERRHDVGDQPHVDEPLIPGEVLYGDEPVVINEGKDVVTVRVENTADRPVQVGSHYHFVRAHDRRPDPAGGHQPVHRDHRGPLRRW